jgi:hypothetical protein
MNHPTDEELTRVLERWAERVQLSGEDAEAIRDTIVTTPRSGLDPARWQELMGRVNGVVVQVATVPQAAQAAMRQALLAPVLPIPS